jgi:hypothetical protein
VLRASRTWGGVVIEMITGDWVITLRVKRLDDDVGDVRKRRIGSVWNCDH